MTTKEKLSFLMSLKARLYTLEAELFAEIDENEPEADYDELDEHAKDVLFMVEDRMNEIEVSAGV